MPSTTEIGYGEKLLQKAAKETKAVVDLLCVAKAAYDVPTLANVSIPGSSVKAAVSAATPSRRRPCDCRDTSQIRR
jgi:hypothetical protein